MGILTAIKRFFRPTEVDYSSGWTNKASVQVPTPSASPVQSTPSASWPERIRVEKSQEEEEQRKLQAEEERRKKAFLGMPSFSELIGQRGCIERLKRFGELYAANARTPEHILITGAEGMGKRMLARAFAKAFNTGIKEVEAGKLQRPADLSWPLTSS